MATDDAIEATWLHCAGPGCVGLYSAFQEPPDGWLLIVGLKGHAPVWRFCSLPCLIRWAGEQP